MTNHTPHTDASKDPASVISALKIMTAQQVAILDGLGATDTVCQRAHDIVQNALMLAVEVTIAQKGQRK